MEVESYIRTECVRAGVSRDAMRESLDVLNQMNPLLVSDVELEMLVMHIALVVDQSNSFKDNWNITPSRRPLYIKHMSYAVTSDPAAWCRKFNEYNFFSSSTVVSNLIFNWLRGQLESPEPLF
ncbi:MAG: hypothetical protein EBU08_00370 [Micrococcales bacterium]|nr:hypothetical protein [Micrococcales bacterium]